MTESKERLFAVVSTTFGGHAVIHIIKETDQQVRAYREAWTHDGRFEDRESRYYKAAILVRLPSAERAFVVSAKLHEARSSRTAKERDLMLAYKEQVAAIIASEQE